MFNATTIDTYVRALINAREESDLIAHNCLSEQDVGNRCHMDTEWYVSDDHLSGFGVTTLGELVGVFSLVKGRGAQLVKHAIYRGAHHLDCFDGFLVTMYAKAGFMVLASVENWNGPQYPRVVYMCLPDAPVGFDHGVGKIVHMKK